MNNLAQHQMCRNCNANLKAATQQNSQMNSGRGSANKSGFKKRLIYIASALLIPVTLFVVVTYSLKSVPANTSNTGEKGFWAHVNDSISSTFSGSSSDKAKSADKSKPAGATKLSIPSNSWFRKASLFNYFRDPAPEEILKQADKFMGTEGLEMPNSIYVKGRISTAIGYAVDQNGRDHLMKMASYLKATKSFDVTFEIKNADTHQGFYEDLGTMEIYASNDGKTYSKALITPPSGDVARIEKTEVLNGVTGWSKEVAYDKRGNVLKNELKNLNPSELKDLKERSTSMWQKKMIKADNSQYAGLERVEFTTCFVLKKTNGAFIEKYYFDAASGAFVKADMEKFSMYFDESKDYNNMKMPAAIRYRTVAPYGIQSWLKVNVEDMQLNQQFDESLLEKPLE